MGRMSKKDREMYENLIETPCYDRDNKRYIFPKGTKIKCLGCDSIVELDNLVATKRINCKLCGQSKKFDIDGISIESVFTNTFSPSNETELGEVTEPKTEPEPEKPVLEPLDTKAKLSDTELKALMDNKEYGLFLQNASEKTKFSIFENAISNDNWDDDTELIAIQSYFNTGNGKLDAMEYKERLGLTSLVEPKEKEPEKQVTDLPQSEKDLIKKTEVSDSINTDFEKRETEIRKMLKTASEKEDDWRHPDSEEKLSKKEIAHVKEMYNRLDFKNIAKTIVNVEKAVVNKFSPEKPLEQNEYDDLILAWRDCLAFYIKDLKTLIKYFPLIILVVSHLTIFINRFDFGKKVKNLNNIPKPPTEYEMMAGEQQKEIGSLRKKLKNRENKLKKFEKVSKK